jgi:hypothetical protein
MEWMQRHILQTADFAEFRRTLETSVHEEPHS